MVVMERIESGLLTSCVRFDTLHNRVEESCNGAARGNSSTRRGIDEQ